MISPAVSQLMSPHGMHLDVDVHTSICSRLPTHVSARNASCSVMTLILHIGLPTHVSARNASLVRVGVNALVDSQLMSPHGMHRPRVCAARADRAPNSCLRTECIIRRILRSWAELAPNSCLRTECISVTIGSELSSDLPTHVSARNASAQSAHRRNRYRSQLMSPHGMHQRREMGL